MDEALRWIHRRLWGFVLLGGLAGSAAWSTPAAALLPPRPQLQWRVGYMWSLNEPGVHGLDWGVGMRVPLQPSEIGLVNAAASVQGTWSKRPEWDFRLGGMIESYRTGRPALGVYYTLRRFPFLDGAVLSGIAFRVGDIAGAFYPAMWNPDAPGLSTDGAVLVVEPAWFSGLYLQLRYGAMMGGSGIGDSALRLAVGLEEDW